MALDGHIDVRSLQICGLAIVLFDGKKVRILNEL